MLGQTLMEAITPFINNLLIATFGIIFTSIGVKVKDIYDTKVTNERVRKVVNTTVLYINQVYKDLDGQTKFNNCKQVVIDRLNRKGLKYDTEDLNVLIESAVNGFKNGYYGYATDEEDEIPEDVNDKII